MNKADLRSQLKQLRNNLSETERDALSQSICLRLETIDWSQVHLLHCFEPIQKLGEVNVIPFIEWLQRECPAIQLYTSRRIDTVWKIVSWHDHMPAEPPDFDAIIVPMLGFDASLQRIGYGGGYYDKFLTTQTKAQKIGVCFEPGKLEYLPAEPHDVALDSIITESKVYLREG